MHEQPLDITPDLAIWVAIFAGAAASVVLVIAAAIASEVTVLLDIGYLPFGTLGIER